MTIKLKQVELFNIRSHRHVVFAPEDKGITLISGANGTGKSSIVDSIAWTLFGTKPHGVSKAIEIINNDADLEKEKSYAIVYVEIDNRNFKIERRIVNKKGAVECDIWELQENDESGEIEETHQAGASVTSAEQYIRKTLRMDEKGFLAAILVQQKQVDKLISSTAKERASVIEKLTGISSITTALEEARQEKNSLQKVASLSSSNEEEIEEFKKELEKNKNLKSKNDSSLEKLSSLDKDYSVKISDMKKTIQNESTKIRNLKELEDEIISLEAKIASQEELLEDAIKEKNLKKEKITRFASDATLSEITPKIQKLKNDLKNLESSKTLLSKNIDDAEIKKNVYVEIIDKSSIKELDKAKEGLNKAEIRLQTSRDKLQEYKTLHISILDEKKKIDKAISIITKEDGHCPTCLQNVKDVEFAVKALENQKELLSKDEIDNNDNIENISLIITKADESIRKFNQLIESIEEFENVNNSLDEWNKDLITINASIKSQDVELSSLEKIFNETKVQEEVNNEYKRILARAKKISADLEELSQSLNNKKETLKSFGNINQDSLQKLRDRFSKLNDDYMDNSVRLSDVRGEGNLIQERILNLSQKISDEEEKAEKYKETLKSVEIAVNTTKLIEEFRENRINNSIPVITTYASDLINRFTEGKFVSLKIDSKFNTKVVLSNGIERPVGLLSGGELSAAAMALRLSISMLLNVDSSQNLIILDEVLVSQDTNRAELILSTIKEVCKGQVILIAHNDIADSIADKIVEI